MQDYLDIMDIVHIQFYTVPIILFLLYGGLDGGGGSRIRYSIKKNVLIRDSISEISP